MRIQTFPPFEFNIRQLIVSELWRESNKRYQRRRRSLRQPILPDNCGTLRECCGVTRGPGARTRAELMPGKGALGIGRRDFRYQCNSRGKYAAVRSLKTDILLFSGGVLA